MPSRSTPASASIRPATSPVRSLPAAQCTTVGRPAKAAAARTADPSTEVLAQRPASLLDRLGAAAQVDDQLEPEAVDEQGDVLVGERLQGVRAEEDSGARTAAGAGR